MKNPSFAIIDVETTGGDPKLDRITEIAIFIFNGKKITEQFCTLVNPEMPIKPFVSKLTGITDEMVQTAPTFREISDKVQAITNGKVFVAHNVRFDFTLVSNEFKRIGIRYRCKQLDTIKVCKKLIPNLNAYGLGRVCEAMGIPIEHRHRAFGDAAATTELFSQLYNLDKDYIIKESKIGEIDEAVLPKTIKQSTIEDLPEEAGIFYFRDEEAKILYLSSTNNIKQKIIDFFNQTDQNPKQVKLRDRIKNIDYQVYGTELISKIIEYDELAAISPEFNDKIRLPLYKYGIYGYANQAGYIKFSIRKITHVQPLMSFFSKHSAMDTLRKLSQTYRLCNKLCGIDKSRKDGYCQGYNQGTCRGACQAEEDVTEYNQRIELAQQAGIFIHNNFVLLAEGRTLLEKAIIHIKDNKYQGYGYINLEVVSITNPEDFLSFIKHESHKAEYEKIIFQFMSKHPNKIKVVPIEPIVL